MCVLLLSKGSSQLLCPAVVFSHPFVNSSFATFLWVQSIGKWAEERGPPSQQLKLFLLQRVGGEGRGKLPVVDLSSLFKKY